MVNQYFRVIEPLHKKTSKVLYATSEVYFILLCLYFFITFDCGVYAVDGKIFVVVSI